MANGKHQSRSTNYGINPDEIDDDDGYASETPSACSIVASMAPSPILSRVSVSNSRASNTITHASTLNKKLSCLRGVGNNHGNTLISSAGQGHHTAATQRHGEVNNAEGLQLGPRVPGLHSSFAQSVLGTVWHPHILSRQPAIDPRQLEPTSVGNHDHSHPKTARSERGPTLKSATFQQSKQLPYQSDKVPVWQARPPDRRSGSGIVTFRPRSTSGSPIVGSFAEQNSQFTTQYDRYGGGWAFDQL